MPKPRRLSGDEVIKILQQFGFVVAQQRGSHVKLRRVPAAGAKEILTVPRHKELDAGTVRAIFKQACRYVPEDQLRPHFFAAE
jgi:predicted RNA binding protein YcfA (HicA-like mRNA interferase family)